VVKKKQDEFRLASMMLFFLFLERKPKHG
jgi:hypothetical protein